MSDLTPTGRYSVLNKWNPLDLFMWYGLFKPEAWDRYFQNEDHYDNYTEQDYHEAQLNAFRGLNLNTVDGRRLFEAEIERFNKLYPAAIAKEGEKIDFTRFYAQYALSSGQDVAKYDQKLIEELKSGLEENLQFRKDPVPGNNLGKKIGKSVPEFLKPTHGHGLF